MDPIITQVLSWGGPGICIAYLLYQLRQEIDARDKERERYERAQEERIKQCQISITVAQESTQAMRTLIPIVEQMSRNVDTMRTFIQDRRSV